METVYLWEWVIQEPSSPQRMEPRGLKEPLEHRKHSKESPTLNNLPPTSSPVSNPH